jgi:hypothetical protein
MPTSQSKRTIVLKSSFSAATVSELNVDADAQFNVTAGSTTNKFQDASGTGEEDITKASMTFANAAGQVIGELTFRVVGRGDPGPAGVTIDKVTRSVISPAAGKGNVQMIDNPDQSYERIWKQAALDSQDVEYVDDIAKLDMRVDAAAGYTVDQAVQTQTDNQLVIAYTWTDANGAPAVSGTVTFATSISVGSGYHAGRIRVTDNNPSTREERRGR